MMRHAAAPPMPQICSLCYFDTDSRYGDAAAATMMRRAMPPRLRASAATSRAIDAAAVTPLYYAFFNACRCQPARYAADFAAFIFACFITRCCRRHAAAMPADLR